MQNVVNIPMYFAKFRILREKEAKIMQHFAIQKISAMFFYDYFAKRFKKIVLQLDMMWGEGAQLFLILVFCKNDRRIYNAHKLQKLQKTTISLFLIQV